MPTLSSPRALLFLAELEPQTMYLEDRVERVVGGEVASPNSWPWQISLQYLSGSRFYHTCGGTLIERGWVMTAAHCVDSVRTWRVVLGEHDLNSNSGREQIMEVARVYIHPKWDSNRVSSGYDIALLRLSSEATLNSYVQLGSLPPSGQILPNNNLCYITGWGRTATGGSLSAQLKQAYLPLVDYQTCSSSDWWGSTVKTTMVCGGGGAEAGCNGDSGGPLNCLVNGKYYVHGIASFVSGLGCNTPKKPTVFTRVSAYIEWMDSVSIRDIYIYHIVMSNFSSEMLADLELQSSYEQSRTAGRVVGGEEVPYHTSWPWQVSLQVHSDGSYHHFCGGTLIRKGWVMTAAHCVYSFSSFRAVLGDLVLHYSHNTEQYRSVINVYIHPEWNNNSISSGNDIALLRLSSEASLTAYVKLASLPPDGEILPHNNPCYITGYGRTSTGGSMSNRMRQAFLPIVDYQTCTSSGWWGSTVKTNMICAGGGAQSGCNGDFGGPLSCRVNNVWYVHGIASFVSGMGCNAPQKPTVFTRVSAFITWMNSVRKTQGTKTDNAKTCLRLCQTARSYWSPVKLLAELEPRPRTRPTFLKDDSTEERVVGGQVANPNSWPWQISLQYQSGGSFYHTCGGTLIRRGWVMTAAHCVDSSRVWRVVLGDHNININEGREQYMGVSGVYIHPNWNTNNVAGGWDIALLRLSSDAALNNYVQLGALPPSGQVLPNNNPCYITGWGRTQTGGQLSAQLKQAYLPVVDYQTCSSSGWWGSTVKNSMVCAGGGSDSGCQGDSGGPLNCSVNGQWVVHGVTSFVSASGCNAYRKPTVFTRVSAYISWMNSVSISNTNPYESESI
ncbi:hypothetical protein L3Q82_024681 [Scortum barcoo]|uniref:Uncharacterized protein n=1 Tax=Scortum barcoo TaxID=214431 RepID=A0ACB8WPY0_9TELE|nr:hypothetical protein L3Q82_024681 [Scortum barcoo]